jgi:crotonobetainyl-CoA:carnitine CoA-transferase CaiB-like acyl-CoA transferase
MLRSGDANVMSGPLHGLRIFDLSRVLAGPSCTQLLGDLGADVIKVERPGSGDDTRAWGPPFLAGPDGEETAESAYFLSANRNKRSLTLDIAQPEGAALARRLIARCDVLVENFKTGGLKKYGLAYDDLADDNPGLVYCSITGFGQSGPFAARPGYDFLIQGMGGIMSVTGEPAGEPMKVGVAIADLMTGMYASSAILAALHHRQQTGRGQMIDLALLDTQVAWLANQGLNYLTSGVAPGRLGNEHPNIVPYKVLPSADGYFILAVGNDRQFRSFCQFAGAPELADDPRFVTNAGRVRHRATLYALLEEITAGKTRDHWVEGLTAAGVPCGPVNTIDQVFAHPQVQARDMEIRMTHPAAGGEVSLIGSPIKYSETAADYRRPPPMLGEHTQEVLEELLGLGAEDVARLRERGLV